MGLKFKQKNKKSMIFTILVITLLSFFLVSYSVFSIVQDRKTINDRIETLNDFVLAIEEDLPRQIYISSFRIIFLFENHITEHGVYISEFNETVNEAFFNGTIYNETQELMQGVTHSGIVESMNEKARKINAEVYLNNPVLTLTQEDPWRVKSTLRANLYIKDKGELASWNKTVELVAYIPVENFEDPLYTINTNSLVTNRINKTIYEPFVQENNVTNLKNHALNSNYINSSLAPSFIDRLQGNMAPNENGIESLVNVEKLSNQGIEVRSKSVVDYIYFSLDNPTSYNINGMQNWFKVDQDHIEIYDVQGLTL